jgi:hypothetical protein
MGKLQVKTQHHPSYARGEEEKKDIRFHPVEARFPLCGPL